MFVRAVALKAASDCTIGAHVHSPTRPYRYGAIKQPIAECYCPSLSYQYVMLWALNLLVLDQAGSDLFSRLDTDGSGTITREEFAKACRHCSIL